MDYAPLIMMGLMALAAGWIANTLLGRSADLVGNIVPGFLGGFVGAYIQTHAKLDLMRIGNPMIEEFVVAVIGAVVVVLVLGSAGRQPRRHH